MCRGTNVSVYLHPRINIHQSSPGDRLNNTVIVPNHLLQLGIAVTIRGAEHQCAHDISDSSGHRRRWVEASRLTR